jgi:hypothetical protein
MKRDAADRKPSHMKGFPGRKSNTNETKGKSQESSSHGLPNRKVSQSQDHYPYRNKEQPYYRGRRGTHESKNQKDVSRWNHNDNNQHHNKKSEFSFELSASDEEICKRTATRAYTTQFSLECDHEVAQCLGMTALAHDRALFDHAQCVHIHMSKAKQFAIEEWLKSKSKEEQIQYLSHHNQQSIVSTGSSS